MRKLFVMVFTVAALSSSIGVARVEAAGLETAEIKDGENILYVNEIEYKYREHNGRLQYRRWNKIKKQWVDSHWIDV